MATKTITIMEDAYELLARNKLEGESFSDTIRRVVAGNKKGIEAYFGCWSEKYGDDILNFITERRKENKDRDKWREEKLFA